jgi:hypothetical protein
MTKGEKLLKILESGRKISALEIIQECQTTSPYTYIKELRGKGYNLKEEKCKKFKRFYIEKEEVK